MCVISPELQAMIAEERRRGKAAGEPEPSGVIDRGILTEIWQMLDEERRKDIVEVPILLPSASAPEIDPELETAIDQADAARAKVDAKIKLLHEHRAARALNCGRRGGTIHLRRDKENGAVEDGLFRFSCGRSSCPHCWRRRITKALRRATRCLLDAPPDELGRTNLPRVGMLHAGEVPWLEWESFDRGIRRQHGGDVGRLRVRRTDGRVLVVCAEPFCGSSPLTPADALDRVCDAIDQLHTARHSYRQLGDWSDRQPPEWRLIQIHHEEIDLGAVKQQLAELGIRSHRLKNPDLQLLIWRAESEAAAESLSLCVLSDFDQGGNRSSPCPNSDAPGGNPWDLDTGPEPKPPDDGWGEIT
jgi:hypothetical protein